MSLTSLVVCIHIDISEQHGITEIKTQLIKWASLLKYCPKANENYFGGWDVNGNFSPSI